MADVEVRGHRFVGAGQVRRRFRGQLLGPVELAALGRPDRRGRALDRLSATRSASPRGRGASPRARRARRRRRARSPRPGPRAEPPLGGDAAAPQHERRRRRAAPAGSAPSPGARSRSASCARAAPRYATSSTSVNSWTSQKSGLPAKTASSSELSDADAQDQQDVTATALRAAHRRRRRSDRRGPASRARRARRAGAPAGWTGASRRGWPAAGRPAPAAVAAGLADDAEPVAEVADGVGPPPGAAGPKGWATERRPPTAPQELLVPESPRLPVAFREADANKQRARNGGFPASPPSAEPARP